MLGTVYGLDILNNPLAEDLLKVPCMKNFISLNRAVAFFRASIVTALAAGLTAISAGAATYYVDSSVSGGTGSSWTSAWSSMSAISGVKSGDTVYISGGPSGSSHTYSIGSGFPAVNGVTYRIGTDSLHNGTATFTGSGTFLGGTPNNVVILGDAGDGQQHFVASGFSIVMWASTAFSNVRLGYINFGNMAGSGSGGDVMYVGYPGNGVTGFEFDHNYVYCSGTSMNAFAVIYSSGSGYDSTKIHDNSIYLPKSAGSGIGADGIECGGTVGLSVYNNLFYGYTTSYGYTQHQDGYQDTGSSSYIKIYGNTFVNMGNAAIFLDGYFGGFSHVRIYNNLLYMAVSVTGAWYPRGMDIISDAAVVSGPLPFTDIAVVNNTVANYSTLYGIGFYAPGTGVGSSYSGNVVANNISYNTTGMDVDSSSGIVNVNNKSVTGSGSEFVKVVPSASAPANFQWDFHLASTASAFLNAGANESSLFTIDKDGNTRPSSGAWDLGAYEYGSSSTPSASLTLSPISQNATDVDPNTSGVQVYEGTTVQYSGTATETGSGTVSWQWLYQINSGSQVVYSSGTGSVSPVNFNYPAGTGGNTYTWTLKAGDGSTNLQSQLVTSVEVPPAPSTNLTFLASAGTITAPFALSGGAVSQTVQTTTVASAGTAVYTFSLATAGNYIIQASINAPNDAANSMFVNIDSTPVDPTMIWDISPLTTNFQSRIVSWRGNGTDTSNQFVPKIFSLSAGTHQVIFAGREANVQLQSFSLLPSMTAPQNLRVLPNVVNAPTFSAGP